MNINTERLIGQTGLEQAAKLLRSGHCVAVPTETVYGLAAIASDPDSVKQVFSIKERPADHPLIVHLPNAEQVKQWSNQNDARIQALADAFWPGPLTLIVNKRPDINPLVCANLPTVALRVPNHPVLLALLNQLDTGLAAPSANLHKKLSPTDAPAVFAGLSGRIHAVLDGGPCQFGLESTILDISGSQAQILRAGPILASDIERILGESVQQPQDHQHKVPGNVAAHYQPRTPVSVVDLEDLKMQFDTTEGCAVLLHSTLAKQWANAQRIDGEAIQLMPDNAIAYGSRLYRTLFELDQRQRRAILVERPPQSIEWAAINDRLKRASWR